jgi:hypothetical protein
MGTRESDVHDHKPFFLHFHKLASDDVGILAEDEFKIYKTITLPVLYECEVGLSPLREGH